MRGYQTDRKSFFVKKVFMLRGTKIHKRLIIKPDNQAFWCQKR
jgi:hypothetical protein